MNLATTESPVDEYEREFAERRRQAESDVVHWAGHFWLAHFAAPLGACAAALLTLAWLSVFQLNRGGWWLIGALVSLIAFASIAYSLAAVVLSAVATVRGWTHLRRRVLLFGRTPSLVVSAESLLVLAAMFG